MALEIEGTLRQKLTPQRGTSARGEWTKQERVVDNNTLKSMVEAYKLKPKTQNAR